jgi:hypothetical protein
MEPVLAENADNTYIPGQLLVGLMMDPTVNFFRDFWTVFW